jgi:hypothetical protein
MGPYSCTFVDRWFIVLFCVDPTQLVMFLSIQDVLCTSQNVHDLTEFQINKCYTNSRYMLGAYTYYIDELNESQVKSDFDLFSEITNRSYKGIVALSFEDIVNQSYFIITTKS